MRGPLQAAVRSERGVSLIEVVVSAFLLVIGLGAVVTSFVATSKQVQVGQRQEQASAIAERELERIRGLDYDDIGLTTLPANDPDGDVTDGETSNPVNPNFYVDGSPARFKIKRNYANSSSAAVPGTPANGEVLVQDAGGVAPVTTLSQLADGSVGKVYRYVTWVDEQCAPNLRTSLDNTLRSLTGVVSSLLNNLANLLDTAGIQVLCGGQQDAKRVTVAVVLDPPGNRAGPTRPTYISTIIAEPGAGIEVDL